MTHIKTYKFKLKPTRAQEQRLWQWLGTTRFIYNLCLEYKSTAYKSAQISLSKNDMQKELTQLRKETPWIKDVHSQVLQGVTDRLFHAYDAFFRRVKAGETPGFPKWAKRDRWSSFSFKQKVKYLPNTQRIKLPSFGSIGFNKSREIDGNIKNATIKRECDGWYITLCCEVDIQPKKQVDECVGLDMGIKDLIITSESEVYSNPRILRTYEKRIRDVQRSLSRKQKNSKNKKKKINELNRLFLKIRRIRRDSLHKISSTLINENQVIVVEKLNIQNMVKRCKPKQDESGKYLKNGQAAKSGLNKSILDASWGMLLEMLKYKAEWHGRELIEVHTAYTSMDCNKCGHRNHDLRLNIREWTCESCGAEHDRDINAAINILKKGLPVLEATYKEKGGGARLLNLEIYRRYLRSLELEPRDHHHTSEKISVRA